ncbi:hypothetical protein SteCoe_2262 [Stentor coeruleus]|uniref:ELMO domain-containing protein n=1 Tax=Stentor coeruleus TaxID=5963 RepID=A0A1R2CZR8_9CILI|nr:hypothetical protein SteCoe_2262 [Stentor coeruleus]
MEKNPRRMFNFNSIPEEKKSSKELIIDSQGPTIETPKFSALKIGSQNPENIIKKPLHNNSNAFFAPKGIKAKTSIQVDEDAAPDIINDDEDFEIDGMGEVWEYAGHSANVNEKESESSSEEFDPNAIVHIQYKEKNEVADEEPQIVIDHPENTPAKIGKKPPKRIDLKTRSLQAEAKLQQIEMKEKKSNDEIPPVKIQEIEVSKERVNEWESISVREIEAVKTEEVKVVDTVYYNRNISSDLVIQSIENSETELPPSEPKPSFFRGLFSCFRVKPRTLTFLSIQKQKLIKFSSEAFDTNQVQHVSMVKKLYTLLRNNDSCPITGEHWREIGFQGSSPGTDLRKVGIFGLLCMLYFIEKYPSPCLEIYKYSADISHKFPFASVCINFSECALVALEDNTLYKRIEKAERVYEIVLDYFCGLIITWFKYYKENNKNVMEIMKTKEHINAYARKHVNEVLNLTKYRFSYTDNYRY